jgi:DNA-binding transcriptional ArsR family regulator
MAARVVVGKRSSREHLHRLALVYALEVRLKIVVELYMQEMSATQFFERFGGSSASRVARNFEVLEKAGWLSFVRSAPGKGGRGKERFYRATELPFFDIDTWALVPYSMRASASWNNYMQIASRLREAIEDRSDADQARDLTSTPLLLDEIGWDRVIGGVDSVFMSFFEEQINARLRVKHTGESLLRADVFLISFETPPPGLTRKPRFVETRRQPACQFGERFAVVLADETCRQIVTELNQREMSAAGFHREFGGSRSAVYRRFGRLYDTGWLERAGEEKCRGATEHFYTACGPAIRDGEFWTNPPNALVGTETWEAFEQLCTNMVRAMKTGVFDARIDRYLTWSFLMLDQRGWENVVARIEELYALLRDEQVRANGRMAKSGEKPIQMS